MSSTKRFYWLKLPDDFFNSKRIKKLRRLAGGDTLTIIYLKLQLLSIRSGGVLKYAGIEETVFQELALDIDEDPDNVRMCVQYLLHTGLAEMSETSSLFLPWAVTNTGSETSSAARMRQARATLKLSEAAAGAQCAHNVQECAQGAALSDGEKE